MPPCIISPYKAAHVWACSTGDAAKQQSTPMNTSAGNCAHAIGGTEKKGDGESESSATALNPIAKRITPEPTSSNRPAATTRHPTIPRSASICAYPLGTNSIFDGNSAQSPFSAKNGALTAYAPTPLPSHGASCHMTSAFLASASRIVACRSVMAFEGRSPSSFDLQRPSSASPDSATSGSATARENTTTARAAATSPA